MNFGARTLGAALVSLWLAGSAYAQTKPGEANETSATFVNKFKSAAKRAEAKQYLVKLIKETPATDKDMPDLLYRYGEVCFEEARDLRDQMLALDDKVFEAKQSKNVAALKKLTEQQATLEKQVQADRLEAFKSYKQLVDDYPNYSKRDEALFAMGYNLQELAQEYHLDAEAMRAQSKIADADDLEAKSADYQTKGLEFYKTLIKDYPDSKLTPDALFALGQDYFNQNDLASAQKVFTKIVSDYPDTNAYGYALFLLGWCEYNQGDYQETIKKWVEVVNYSRAHPDNKTNLQDEALKEIPRAYAQFGTPQKAKSFFQKIAADQYPAMLLRLGELYRDQGQFQDAIYTYKEVINLDPKSDDNYLYQYEVAKATFAATSGPGITRKNVIDELKTLTSMYQAMQSRSAPKEKLDKAQELSSQFLRELATSWHAECAKTKAAGCLESVQPLYEQYLKTFPSAADHYDMSFYYAELLYSIAQGGDGASRTGNAAWETAMLAYIEVVDSKPDGAHAKEAGQGAGSSAVNIVDTGSQTRAATPLSELEKTKLRALTLYLKYDPGTANAVFAQATIGYMYWLHQMDAEATPVLQDLVDHSSGDAAAIKAAGYLLVSLDALKDEKSKLVYADKILKDPNLSADPTLSLLATNIVASSSSKLCQSEYDSGQFSESGSCFLGLYEGLPKLSDDKRRALVYNAALSFEKAKQLGTAMTLRAQLIADYPKSDEAQRSLFALGNLYASIGSYKKASELLEEFAADYPSATDAAVALNDAAIYREGLDDYDTANADNNKFLQLAAKRGADTSAVAEGAFRAVKLVERAGNDKKTQAAYEDYLKTYATAGSLDNSLAAQTWVAANLWKNGKHQDAIKRCQDVVNAVDALGKDQKTGSAPRTLNTGLDAAAECQFYIAEQGFAVYTSLKLPEPFSLEAFSPWFETTKKTRDEVSALYLKATTYNSKNWTLASLARIGMMSYKFMENLSNAPFPAKLLIDGKLVKFSSLPKATQDEILGEYGDALAKLIEPLRQDALTSFNLCIEGSTKASYYNEWSSTCEQYLNTMEPSLYPLAVEWKVAPDKEGDIAVPAALVTTLR